MIVDRPGDAGARRLHDEDVGAADVLVDLERELGIGKTAEARLADGHPVEPGDLARQLRVRAAGKHFQLPESRSHERITYHHGSLANWLGRKDSNLRIRDP